VYGRGPGSGFLGRRTSRRCQGGPRPILPTDPFLALCPTLKEEEKKRKTGYGLPPPRARQRRHRVPMFRPARPKPPQRLSPNHHLPLPAWASNQTPPGTTRGLDATKNFTTACPCPAPLRARSKSARRSGGRVVRSHPLAPEYAPARWAPKIKLSNPLHPVTLPLHLRVFFLLKGPGRAEERSASAPHPPRTAGEEVHATSSM